MDGFEMTDVLKFRKLGKIGNENTKPFHYTACGVDGIYLLNGFHLVEDEGYGPGVVIDDADDLHMQIGLSLVSSRPHLSYLDVRFLRHLMDKTQTQLANEIGVSSQMIARYEKIDQVDISGPADRLIRAVFVTNLFPEKQPDVMQVIIDLFERVDEVAANLVFKRAKEHWGLTSPVMVLAK